MNRPLSVSVGGEKQPQDSSTVCHRLIYMVIQVCQIWHWQQHIGFLALVGQKKKNNNEQSHVFFFFFLFLCGFRKQVTRRLKVPIIDSFEGKKETDQPWETMPQAKYNINRFPLSQVEKKNNKKKFSGRESICMKEEILSSTTSCHLFLRPASSGVAVMPASWPHCFPELGRSELTTYLYTMSNDPYTEQKHYILYPTGSDRNLIRRSAHHAIWSFSANSAAERYNLSRKSCWKACNRGFQLTGALLWNHRTG
jgi:hypothetical protein